MADPVSLAVIGLGATAAGGGAAAFGNYFSGKAQGNMYNYQAGVAQANAQVAKQDAIYATQSGEVQAQQSGMRTRSIVGATKVGYGAGNIDSSTGSAKNVIASTTEVGQQNQGIIRADAAKRAYGFNVAAAGDIATAGADEVAVGTSHEAAGINIASTILGTVGSVSSKWSQGQQQGIFASQGSS